MKIQPMTVTTSLLTAMIFSLTPPMAANAATFEADTKIDRA